TRGHETQTAYSNSSNSNSLFVSRKSSNSNSLFTRGNETQTSTRGNETQTSTCGNETQTPLKLSNAESTQS
ncbi:hypothetical protein DPMN_058201, partial [Dreissena polymorpha]